MSPDRLARLMAVFDEVCALSPGERGARLDALCAGDDDLRRSAQRMLDADGRSDLPIDAPGEGARLAASCLAGALERARAGRAPPTLTGRYQILGVLGEGGMGIVYEAMQSSPRRRVALKALRSGLVTDHAVARFAQEADVLARLHHPGIAQVFEGGIADESSPDTAFFVMELVEGTTLTENARANALTVRERAELLAKVCDAVHHAHQRGVIHRDLKPSNILVGASGQPKVLDFGVARIVEEEGLDRRAHTTHGQVIGTLGYMSPEQLDGKHDEIGAESDVYSLGVLLYELLAERPPFDLAGIPLHEASRIVRETTPPPPSRFNRACRGDLSTIVARAMHADQTRRYRSAAALADDLRRWIDGLPISARRDSTVYVVSKLARRHWLVTTLGVTLAASVCAFASISFVQALEFKSVADEALAARELETIARRAAESERQRASALNERLRAEHAMSQIERGRAEALAGNGLAAEGLLWPIFFDNPASDAARWALVELYSQFPCAWTSAVPGAERAAASRASRAIVLLAGSDAMASLSAEDGSVLARAALDSPASQIAFLDDDRAVSTHLDGSARLWRIGATTIEPLREWRAHDTPAHSLAVHPSRPEFATGSFGGETALWSVDAHEPLARFEAHAGPVQSMAYHPAGVCLVTGGRDFAIRVWSPPDPAPVATLEGHDNWILSLVFVEIDGAPTLVSGGRDRFVRVWDLDRARPSREFRNATDPRGLFASGTPGSVIVAHSFGATELPLGMGDSRSFAYSLSALTAWTHMGDTFVTVEGDGRVRLWETAEWPSVTRHDAHASWVFSAEFSPDGALLASASGDSTVKVWCADTLGLLSVIDLPPGVRSRMARFSPDGRTLAIASSDGLTRLASVPSFEVVATLGAQGQGEVFALEYSRDGARIATAGGGRAVRVWDTRDGSVTHEFASLERLPRGVALSPDGSTLYASGGAQSIAVFDLARGERLEGIPIDADAWCVAVSPDGGTLAVGSLASAIEFVDLSTGARTTGSSRHQLVVAGLAFSPQGTMVASGGDDGFIKVWDPASGRMLISLPSAGGEVPGLTFHPTRRVIAGATSAGRVVLWDLDRQRRHTRGNLRHALGRLAREPHPDARAAELDALFTP